MPFPNRKKAGIHNNIAGRVKNIEITKSNAENKSITLKTSPVKTKRPLTKSRPAVNNKNCEATLKPKINIKNAIAAARSIPPKTLTSTIK